MKLNKNGNGTSLLEYAQRFYLYIFLTIIACLFVGNKPRQYSKVMTMLEQICSYQINKSGIFS